MADKPAATPISASIADELAGRITATRLRVAGIFDQLATQSSGPYLDFKLAALGAATDRAAFAAALIRASQRGFIDSLVKSLIEVRGLDVAQSTLGEEGELVLSPTLKLTPQDATGTAFRPQGWDASMINLISVEALLPAVISSSRRVCSVMVNKDKVGSGFLVGPQTVLTNWHVVHTLIDAAGHATPGSDKQLQCVFDYLDSGAAVVHPAVPDWLVDWSPMSVSPGAMITGDYPNLTALKAHALDYCIIRLRGAPGRARGWYDLDKSGVVSGADVPFFVVQHPEQMAQRMAVAKNATQSGNIIKHMALTLGGSSGGLCLNAQFELVGLHQGQITRKNDKNEDELETNLAVSSRAIATVGAPPAASVDPMFDAIWITQRNRLAVVGRSQTLNYIAAMTDRTTPTPIMLVRGLPGAGKRFTVELIEDRLAQPDRWIARLDAATLPAGAREVADLILQKAEISEADRDTLSKPANAGTTDIGWIREPLFREFAQLVTKAASGRLLWIVLENLDRVDIVPTAARTFLDVLYDKVSTQPQSARLPLRVVLLGLDGGLPTGDPNAALIDDLRDPDTLDPNEVSAFVSYVCAERGLSTTADEISRLKDLILVAWAKWPDGGPNGRLSKLGNLLSKVVYPKSQEWK